MNHPPGLPPPMGFPPMVPTFNLPPPGFGPPGDMAAGFPVQTTDWTEHKAPDGRLYYYNTVTKQSSWDKPDELKTPVEKIIAACPWKEHRLENGKKYYHNSATKDSKWDPPEEFLDMQAKVKAEEAAAAAKAVAAMTSSGIPPLIPPLVLNTGMVPAKPLLDFIDSPNSRDTPGSTDASSAMDQAMAATLASIEIPQTPSKPEDIKKPEPEVKIEFKDKKEAIDAFKDFLKEKNIPSTSNWDNCVKVLSKDPRYSLYKNIQEKKQTFNAYKTQKLKDEREEQRLKAKKAKEDLEKYLMATDKMTSQTKYYKCEEIFAGMKIWTTVPEPDRRDIYEDCIFNLAKREKEQGRLAKKRNMKALGEVLESMSNVTYSTTWSEAQVMLLDNSAFKNDVSLLGMDKEDALIVFEEHIRQLEKEEEEDKEREKKRTKRQQRKNRDSFLSLLDSLHEEGKLTSMSLWVELYPLISADLRFSAMLGQSGSTPLDLFKFYVENLKSKFHDEKKIIKDILKEKQFIVKGDTSFEEFATAVCEDKRSANLDAGNVKLTYNSMLEKAEAVEKEKQKEESRRTRKLENEIKLVWMDGNLSNADTYESAKKLVQELEAFSTYEREYGSVQKVWDDFIKESEDACSHHHSRSRKSKKNKKHKKRMRSSSKSEEEADYSELEKTKKKKHSRSGTPSSSEDSAVSERGSKKKKKKKKHKKTRDSSYESDKGSDGASQLEEIHHKKKKKDKKKKDKDRKRSVSPEGISSASLSNGSKQMEEQALSESELVSKRAALLAQLNEQID